jgi:hypothetical protein
MKVISGDIVLVKYTVIALAALSLVGCGGYKMVNDESGDGSQFTVLGSGSSEKLLDLEMKRYSDKLSKNFHDYPIQYYVAFGSDMVKAGESPKVSGGGAWAAARDIGGSIAAADLIGSTIFGGSGMGTGFNIGMIGLAMIAPQSPEERFVSDSRYAYKTLTQPGVTFIRIDSVSESASKDELNHVFSKRNAELRRQILSAGFRCDGNYDRVISGLYRETPGTFTNCSYQNISFHVKRRTELAMPESIARKVYGPGVVSYMTYSSLPESLLPKILEGHAKLLENGWAAIYPEYSKGVMREIVVSQGGIVKRYPAPKNPFPEK